MSNLVEIKGLIKVNGVEVHNIYGEFGEHQKCILAKEIALVHGIELRILNEKINRNIKRFRFGIDILDLKNSIANCDSLLNMNIYSKQSLSNSTNIYLFSRKGYLKLVGLLEDDLAYDIQDKMIDEYFELKQLQISEEDKLCLNIIKAENQEDRMFSVGELVQFKNKQIEKKEEQLQLQAPKVAMAERFATSDSLMGIRKVAKIINQRIDKNKAIGEKKLFEILRNEQILQSNDGEWNIPYQQFIDRGYFELKPSTYDNGYGKIKTEFTPKVTSKGLEWIWKQLLKKGYIKEEYVKVS